MIHDRSRPEDRCLNEYATAGSASYDTVDQATTLLALGGYIHGSSRPEECLPLSACP